MSIVCSSKIRKEPKHTCPLIDSVIDILSAQFGNKDRSIDIMEDIRDNCSEIRNWGEEWKEYAEFCEEESKDYETRLDDANEQLSEKETEISDLQKTINELEDKIHDLTFDLKYNYKKIEE